MGGLESAERSPKSGKKDMGTENEVKYERNSLLPNNVPRTSLGRMPENELRSKIHGLYDSFFFVGSVDFLPEGRRLPAGCQNKFSVPRLVSARVS